MLLIYLLKNIVNFRGLEQLLRSLKGFLKLLSLNIPVIVLVEKTKDVSELLYLLLTGSSVGDVRLNHRNEVIASLRVSELT
jgi:hypothetical protein